MQRDAWCLTLQNGHQLAIAQKQVVEYLTHVDAITVPDCNEQCQQVVLWRDKIVPLWGSEKIVDGITVQRHVLVVSFASGNELQQTELLALNLKLPPVLVQVVDEDQCAPNEEQKQYWNKALLACFQYQGCPVPIVNFSSLAVG